MPKTKSPVTAAVAALQPDWHCRQAAEHYADSERKTVTARGRETARKRFIENTRLALPTMGLERFLRDFKAWLCGSGQDAEPIIRELWAEHLARQAGAPEPLPVTVDACGKLAAARQLLQLIGEQIDAALSEPQTEGK